MLFSGTARRQASLICTRRALRDARAEAAAGIWQVGSGNGPVTGGNDHAVTSTAEGQADTVVDLHSSLDQTGLLFSLSLATGVNENGDIVG